MRFSAKPVSAGRKARWRGPRHGLSRVVARRLQLEGLEPRTLMAADDVLEIGPSSITLPQLTPGELGWLGGSGDANSLQVSVAAGTYTFTDSSALIILGQNAQSLGWIGSGTNTVTGPASTVTSMLLDGSDDGGTADTIQVASTQAPVTIQPNSLGIASGTTQETVTIGSAASGVQGINGAITITNSAAATNLTITDATDTATQAVTITSGAVAGLAPQTINYDQTALASLSIVGGAAARTYTINGTPSNSTTSVATTLASNATGDTVNVVGTSATVHGAPLDIISDAQNSVDVGAGSTQGIFGPVDVTNSSTTTALTIDDSSDTTTRSTTLDIITASTVTGVVGGIAPAAIQFTPSDLSSLTIRGGSGGNDYTINDTPAGITTTIFGGLGSDSTQVNATTGPLTLRGQGFSAAAGPNAVTIGNPTTGTQSINGTVLVIDAQLSTKLTIDNSGSNAGPTNVQVKATSVTGISPAAIDWNATVLASLTILDCGCGNTFTVNTTPSSPSGGVTTVIDPGTGSNVVNVLDTTGPGSAPNPAAQTFTVNVPAGSTTNINVGDPTFGLSNIGGNLSLVNSPSSTTNITLDDAPNPASFTATLLGELNPNPVGYIQGASGVISFSTEGVSLKYLAGTGNSTLTVDFGDGGINPIPSGGLTLVGGGGFNTLNIKGQLATGRFQEETYAATGPGAGSINLDDSVISFSNLSPINDVAPATNFEFDAPTTTTSNSIKLVDGPIFSALQTATIEDGSGSTPAAFELINFGNKTNATINFGTTSTIPATLLLDNPTQSSGVQTLTVESSNAPFTANVQHTPAGIAVAVDGQSANDTVNVALLGLGTGGNSSFSVDGGGGTDTLNVDATGATSLNYRTVGSISAQSGTTPLNYANIEQVNITNAPSTPAQGGAAVTVPATEGQQFPATAVASFSNVDPGSNPQSFLATINWGDGTQTTTGSVQGSATSPGSFTVNSTHTYAEEGTYPITVTVTNQGESGNTTVGSVPFHVTSLAGSPTALSPRGSADVVDAPLTPGPPLSITATEGVALASGTVVATFTDTNPTAPLSDFSAMIDWGDGSPQSPATVTLTPTAQGLPSYTVLIASGSSHAYSQASTFPLDVIIHDIGGSSTNVVDHVNVVSSASSLSSQGVSLTFPQGSTLPANTVIATFSDTNPSTSPRDYNASINWGDGTTTPGTIAVDPAGGFDVLGGHTYASPNTFTITTTITSIFQTSTTAESTVTGLSLIVTNTNDHGAGSLRQALINAQKLGPGKQILFQIPTPGPYIVKLQSTIAVGVPVVIDTTGMLGGFKFVLDGSGIIAGRSVKSQASVPAQPDLGQALLDVVAQGVTIRGLGFVHYAGYGVALDVGSGSDRLLDNTIGVDETGSIAEGNKGGGVLVLTAHNMIGMPGHGNIISANGTGIMISGSGAANNAVYGNHIGTNASGTKALGNLQDGVAVVGASLNAIGGPGAGQGNVIAGNGTQVSSASTSGGAGVYLFSGATQNHIQGNTFASAGIGNISAGVLINSSNNNLVGGSAAGAGNMLSGNVGSGVIIESASGNAVAGNTITRNGNAGIYLLDASHNAVGLPGHGNSISGNLFSGIVIFVDASGSTSSPLGNVVRYNVIRENHEDGIYVLNAPGNVIGGAGAAGNQIILNGYSGVELNGAGATGNAVLGNTIADHATNAPLSPNFGPLTYVLGGYGVLIQNASGNVVGATGAGNVFQNNELGSILVVVRGRPLPPTSTNGNTIGKNTTLRNSQSPVIAQSAHPAGPLSLAVNAQGGRSKKSGRP